MTLKADHGYDHVHEHVHVDDDVVVIVVVDVDVDGFRSEQPIGTEFARNDPDWSFGAI
ncbi:MAG TPA: hypothetical protein VGQ81_16345 [Acidobacteriota bacterium]|jgi:hypothetical protein|nr:hypothetical protein [Acidobacteriota bacterium]